MAFVLTVYDTFSNSARATKRLLYRKAGCSRTFQTNLRSHNGRRATIVSDSSGRNGNSAASNGASTPDKFAHNSNMPLDGSETRAKFDSITHEGEQLLNNVADDIRNEMGELSDSLEEFADKMIQEETAALLEKYGNRQNELLENVREERRIIEEEMNRFSSLSSSSNAESSGATTPLSEKLLLAATFLFGLASVVYTWTAIATTDSTALQNAVIDMAVAVCAAYVLSYRRKK